MTDNELLREALDKASANLLAAARENARLRAVVEAARIIDTMPVDGCSPSCIESMLRQAKTLCNAALRALEGGE